MPLTTIKAESILQIVKHTVNRIGRNLIFRKQERTAGLAIPADILDQLCKQSFYFLFNSGDIVHGRDVI